MFICDCGDDDVADDDADDDEHNTGKDIMARK